MLRAETNLSVTPTSLSYGTVTSEDGFAALEPGWDRLVRAMPRASPFLLHGLLSAWFRHGARGASSGSRSHTKTASWSRRCRCASGGATVFA
jgi:hypothetical protein